MKKPKTFHKKNEKLLGTELQGLLVASYGATAEVEDENGELIRCHLRKNIEPVITGDHVLWLRQPDNTGIVVGHLPRKSFLARPENKNKLKAVAANIDVMLIVTSPPPILTEYLIDRYIVAAEHLNIRPVILLNKIDLLTEKSRPEVLRRLAVYEKLGYQVMFSSAYTKDGLRELEDFFRGKTSILVGTSGVGKSTIISIFVSEELRIGETSVKGLGKHTTIMTRLYHFPEGGDLIDSPGVREFGLWNMSKEEILEGFVDFKPYLHKCRFRDCKHGKEPDCAILKAVAEGEIDKGRFESYLQMISDL